MTILIALFSLLLVSERSLPEPSEVDPISEVWDSLTVMPKDKTEAQNLRIWLAQEQSEPCSLKVEIQDASGRTVRHLPVTSVEPGYYNLYWDKLDDSGMRVSAGDYTYVTNDCGGNRDGKLQVKYKKGEYTSSLDVSDWPDSGLIRYELTDDSAHVTLEICNHAGRVFRPIFRDSVMAPGIYTTKWLPTRITRLVRTSYIIRLIVDEFTHEAPVKLEPMYPDTTQ